MTTKTYTINTSKQGQENGLNVVEQVNLDPDSETDQFIIMAGCLVFQHGNTETIYAAGTWVTATSEFIED